MSRRRQPIIPSARKRTLKQDLSNIIRGSHRIYENRTPIQLLIIASYMNRLKFIETINAQVRWDEKHCKFSPGVLAQLLVLLPFVSALRKIPLSRIHEAYSGIDLELLVGEPIDPLELNDDLFARLLDRLYEADCSKLLVSISFSVRLTFNLPENIVLHSDTTSHVLYGDYIPDEGTIPPISITYGFSKQKRNDLKQIQTGMVTDGDGLILFSCPLDGNKADCTYNNEVILRLKEIYGPEFSKYIYIADSKLLTKPNFDSFTQSVHPIRFISKIPENFHKKIAEKVRVQAFEEDRWVSLGHCCNHPDPTNSSEYSVFTKNVSVYGHPCYVHLFLTSDGEKKTQKAIEKAESSLKDLVDALLKKEFACEPDAIAEINRFKKEHSADLVNAILTVQKIETWKRGRGRPGKNAKPPVLVVTWKIVTEGIQRNEPKIDEKRRKASTFALLTNIPPDDLSSQNILLHYKGQIKVEHNFMLLKEPLVAATIFLEKPERIMALMTMLYFSVLMHGILRVITHIELEKCETPPKINSNNRPLVRPNSDTIIWILSLFTLVSGEDGYHIESKMSDRKGQISTLFQLTRFDLDFI
ncbi:IS1634 family transposase [Methanospirillum sp.]